MSDYAAPDFTSWDSRRLTEQRDHLVQILMTMAGQPDPLKPKLRAELAAIRAEIARRELAPSDDTQEGLGNG
jgi:hypothetical protein